MAVHPFNNMTVHGGMPFTMVPNCTAQDSAMTFGARGLLTYLLSKAGGGTWEMRQSDILDNSPAGRDAVKGLINELTTHGYIVRWRFNGPSGAFIWKSEVFPHKQAGAEWLGQNTDAASSAFRPSPHKAKKSHSGKSVDGLAVDGETALNHSGKSVDIYKKERSKKEQELFSESEISANGQESGGEAPPQPRPAQSSYTHPIDKMVAQFGRGKEAVSYRQVKQWHVGNSSKIDPDFIAYLQRGDLISFIKAEPPSAERVGQWLSIANRTTPEGQDRLDLATKAWYSFDHERDAIAARTAAKHKALHKNDPENNVAYRRFSEALEKTGKLRCVVQSFDHFGLRIVIEHKGKKLVTSHTFGRMSLTLLFTELRKVDNRWVTEVALADRLGLREFYEMCSFEAVA
jgi:hypothetical protein